MTLKAAQLQQAPELETMLVPVPEWAVDGDDEVLIRVMDGMAMSAYQSRMQAISQGEDGVQEHEHRKRVMVEYCAACIIDPETEALVFDTPELVDVLAKKNGKGLNRVFEAAAKLHRDIETEAEGFRKNSETPALSATGGSTPSTSDTPTPT